MNQLFAQYFPLSPFSFHRHGKYTGNLFNLVTLMKKTTFKIDLQNHWRLSLTYLSFAVKMFAQD